MQSGNLVQRIRAQQRAVIYGLGICIVSIWTLLRFFTERTIFDLVSQQVVVHQWLHGSMSLAHMGQTAYVPKMLLLYAPLDLLPGSPRLKLILLTLVINAVTFVLLGGLAAKILREYRIHVSWPFDAALLWLSVIAGSVFWIEFANSRNLEVAGGVLLLYLGLRYMRRPSARLGLGVVAFGAGLFFGDPLQVYMTALPLIIYCGILGAAKKEKIRTFITLGGALVLAYLGSRLLFMAVGRWLHLSFTDTGNAVGPHLSAAWFGQSATGTVRAAVSLLAGANDAGRLREAANLALLLFGFFGLQYTILRKRISRRLLLLVACICTTDILVYIASGQAVQGTATSRYLIMTVPALVLAFGAIRVPKPALRPATAIIGAGLLLNVAVLTVTLATHWNTAFPADAHLASTYRYTRREPGVHVYASTDTAMPLLYLQKLPAAAILPVGCLDGKLVQTHFSMDQAFAQNAAASNTMAAIILDGNNLSNTPNVCTVASVSHQFGPPQSIDETDDGSIVMRYPQTAIQLPE